MLPGRNLGVYPTINTCYERRALAVNRTEGSEIGGKYRKNSANQLRRLAISNKSPFPIPSSSDIGYMCDTCDDGDIQDAFGHSGKEIP